MKDYSEIFQNFFIGFLRFTIFIAIFIAFFESQWALAFSSFLILLFTFLPYFFERNTRVNLPLEFEFVIVLFIYASFFLGEIYSYYTRFWWWDIVLHTSSGLALGFAGFLIVYVLYFQNKIKANPILVSVFAFCFGMAIGAVWEIFEFAMDQIFGFNMQKSGLLDTMWDLIVDAVGAFIISFVGYYYIKGRKVPLFTRFLKKFSRENPGFLKV
jgi:hypothetical protein